MELMRTYNTEKAIVFNTYQCYLKKAHKTITLDLEQVLHYNSSIKYLDVDLIWAAITEKKLFFRRSVKTSTLEQSWFEELTWSRFTSSSCDNCSQL